MIRRFVLAIAFLACLSSPGYSNTTTVLLPLTITGFSGNKLHVTVEPNCGTSFYGFVINPSVKGELKIAGVGRTNSIACVALPKTELHVIDWIDPGKYKSIRPMNVSRTSGHLRVSSFTDFRLVRKNSSYQFEGLYQPTCGTKLGSLIRTKDERSFEIANLELLARGQRAADCPKILEKTEIDGLAFRNNTQVYTFAPNQKQHQKAFSLHIAPIAKNSINQGHKSLSLTYIRRCEEAPVGVVIANKKNGTAIGMLVARYYNLKCQSPKKATVYKISGVNLNNKKRLKRIKPTNAPNVLAIHSPTSFSRSDESPKKLEVEHLNSCHHLIGAVYTNPSGESSDDKVSVGILQYAKNHQTCKKPMRERTLTQNFVAPGVKLRNIYPLHIRGYVN